MNLIQKSINMMVYIIIKMGVSSNGNIYVSTLNKNWQYETFFLNELSAKISGVIIEPTYIVDVMHAKPTIIGKEDFKEFFKDTKICKSKVVEVLYGVTVTNPVTGEEEKNQTEIHLSNGEIMTWWKDDSEAPEEGTTVSYRFDGKYRKFLPKELWGLWNAKELQV